MPKLCRHKGLCDDVRLLRYCYIEKYKYSVRLYRGYLDYRGVGIDCTGNKMRSVVCICSLSQCSIFHCKDHWHRRYTKLQTLRVH